ncbi:MAG: YjjG family noncanonical pyrimidine nucleotidase [Bacteroidales bacterium]|nr:YjjG family noncanonical pyrimidine nucleotidase [Bacteroidales bacterium]
MAKKYKHLFFDLDRTLWDFEKSAKEAFHDLFFKYKLNDIGIQSPEEFHMKFSKHNNRLWDLYREGKIEKEILIWKRFFDTFREYGTYDEELSKNVGQDYLFISPRIVNLYPNAIEILEYLKPNYHLHIITNGFLEVQKIKISTSKIEHFFKNMITSEEAGVKKPHPDIFSYALQQSRAKAEESLMIGDDYEVDILGARNVGIDQVLFDPEAEYLLNGCTYKISNLIELKEIL